MSLVFLFQSVCHDNIVGERKIVVDGIGTAQAKDRLLVSTRKIRFSIGCQ